MGSLEPHELAQSKISLVCLTQRQVFGAAYEHLALNKSLVGFRSSGGEARHVIRALVWFCLFMDLDGCLHVSGCLNRTPLSGTSKHLVTLPKHHLVTPVHDH